MDRPDPSYRRQRRYTDEEAAATLAVLAENGGNVAATSRATGIPEQTIREWRNGTVRILPPEVVEQERLRRAQRWESIVDAAQDVIAEKLPDASARDAAIIAGIGTEKGLLLRGEATSITESRDDERVRLLRERYGRLHPAPAPIVVTPLPAQADTGPVSLPPGPAKEGPQGEAPGGAPETCSREGKGLSGKTSLSYPTAPSLP